MKYKTTAVLITATLTVLLTTFALEARGGGGRGGGGGGRGGGGFDRTPSMSRAGRPDQSFQRDNFQNRGVDNRNFDNRAMDNRAVDNRVNNDFRRPNEQGIQNFLSPTASRDNLHQFMNSGTGALGASRALDAGDFSRLQSSNQLTADRVRGDLARNNPAINGMFDNNFFRDHGVPYYLAAGTVLNRAADWNSMSNWLSWGGTAPLYYDNSGYVSTVPVTSQNYSSTTYPNNYGNSGSNGYTSGSNNTQSTNSNTAGAQSSSTNSDWMSLGVYALGEDANQLSNSTMFLQLTLKKDGTIAGTYYNTSTNQTYLVDGEVDQTTQQAAWKLTDNNYTTLMKTGLYNLTQSQTPVTVQFSDGTKELWQMVRMNN